MVKVIKHKDESNNNCGLTLENIAPLHNDRVARVSLGDAVLVMRKYTKDDYAIYIRDCENLSISECCIVRVNSLKYWLVRKLISIAWSKKIILSNT